MDLKEEDVARKEGGSIKQKWSGRSDGTEQARLYNNDIMRWALVIFIFLIVILTSIPTLRRFGVGRLPGDLSFRVFGRQIELPFMSTILLFIVAVLVGKLL